MSVTAHATFLVNSMTQMTRRDDYEGFSRLADELDDYETEVILKIQRGELKEPELPTLQDLLINGEGILADLYRNVDRKFQKRIEKMRLWDLV